MAATIKIKNSSTTGAVPTSGDLVQGELAVNVTDTGLYTENASGTVVKLNAPSIDDKNTGATKHLTISTGGNLGLGVTPSAWVSSFRALDMYGTGSIASASDNMNMTNNAYFNGTNYIYKANGAANRYAQSGGVHYWFTGASGTAGNAITFTQAMTLDASGNLGVGVTSPSYKLDVAGSARITAGGSADTILGYGANYDNYFTSGASGIQVFRNSSGTERARIDSSGNLGVGTTSPTAVSNYKSVTVNGTTGGLVDIASNGTVGLRLQCDTTYPGGALFTLTNQPMIFGTNGTERARIDSSGNLLVGRTSTGQGGTTGVAIDITSGNGSGNVWIANSGTTGSQNPFTVYSTGASAYRFYLGMQGQVYATNTTITAISDQRLKENIRDLNVGLAEVMALKPRVFDWKEGKGADIKNARGFIAQEFEEVFPDLIDEWKDPAPEGEEPYKSVRADLIPVLVKAIQEQQAIIEGLTARITALEQA